MPAPVQRKDTEGDSDRQRHTLKLWICRARNSDLIIDDLYFFCLEIEVWRIKITGSKSSSVTKPFILAYFFKLLCSYKHFALFQVSIFCNATLAFHVESNGITGRCH